MNKDLSLLKGVSVYFTEETLRSVVAKEKNVDPKVVEILGWDFGRANAKGDSHLSVVQRVKIKSKVNDNETEMSYIVKSFPQNIGRKKTFRSEEFFYNEITFYNEVATKFEEYLKSKGQSQLMLIPRCYASLLDGDNDYIVLQDVSVDGFGPLVRQASLTYEQCKSAAETLARFHAISFGFKRERKEEFEEMVSKLMETFYREDLYEKWYKRFFESTLVRIARDSLAKEYPGSRGEKVFNSYQPIDFFKKSTELCCSRAHEPTSVIGQGDAWAPNFLAREAHPGKFELLLLDFQLARCCSPVLDIVFFIYSCTDKTMRDQHYEDLLKNYYDELIMSMKLLDIPDAESVYPWDLFRKEVKEQSVYGLTFSLEAVPFTMMPEEEAFDLDQIKEKEIDLVELFTLPNIKLSENRKRHADMILHAVENGYI
ncbi:uncharacterized protein LOC106643981 [Copidosoma floridanum]|uniref:uncharacterized protein LOC106643981 n=1 Tax=Copidosoma floridanum TaxID=29053 RepID=UPI0006C9CB88|nr:uncharacterized protein LOC106643981 [Copidosoma floridanum]